MARQVDGSVVVITGASSGIGRASANAFAAAGASVVLAARREDALDEVALECEEHGGRALVVPTDVADPEAVELLGQAAINQFGRIDTWVNNAAVGAYGRFEDVPLDAFRRTLEVNLFGYVHGSRVALKRFREQEGGVLIQNASIVARVPHPFLSAYVASKYAVLGMSLSLRQELALDADGRIHVCLVLPSVIDTPFYAHAAHFGGVRPRIMPPVFPPEQVADAIVGLARRPRREVIVGFSGKAFALQEKLAPATTERQVALLADRLLVEKDPGAPDVQGALFEPVARGTRATGGHQPEWSGAARVASFGLLMLGGALLLAPGIGGALAAGLLGAAVAVGTKRHGRGPWKGHELPHPASDAEARPLHESRA